MITLEQRMLSTFKRTIYRTAMGKSFTGELDEAGQPQPVAVGMADLLGYLWQKGGPPLLRGMLVRPRLGACGGRLFWGRGVRLLFGRHLRLGRNVAIGDGCYLSCFGAEGVTIGDNVRLKEQVWLQVTGILTEPGRGVAIGHDTYIGPHCTLGAGGGLRIGANVTIGAYVDLLAEDHAFADSGRPINRQGVVRQGIVIEDDCWIGNKVIVLDGVRVGRGSVIGAGAVVTRTLPPYSVAVGSPARVIRTRSTPVPAGALHPVAPDQTSFAEA